MTNLDSILKSRDITLPTKVHLVKAMVFPMVMYGCESWTVKKAEHKKNWCFWTVVLEKTLESPLDCKEIQSVHPKGDQSWVFIGRTDTEAETPVLWPPHAKRLTHWKRPWCWEGLGAGGEGDDRGWDGWMAPPNWWTWVWVDSGSWWWTGRPGVLWFMGSQRIGHNWVTELTDWCSLENLILLIDWVHVGCSHLSSVQLFVMLWTLACQAPQSIEFSQQEYWRGLPCPPPGDFSDPSIKLMSHILQVDSSPLSHRGSQRTRYFILKY